MKAALGLAWGVALAASAWPGSAHASGGAGEAETLSSQVLRYAGLSLTVALITALVGALIAAIWIGWAYFNREKLAVNPFNPEEKDRIESSRFEQILAELQGIRLGFESRNDTGGNYEKFGRLVRLFVFRAGVPTARDLPIPKLKDAMASAHFSAKHAQMIAGILDKCEVGAQRGRKPVDFDPQELVKDFQYVIDQIEGREPKKED